MLAAGDCGVFELVPTELELLTGDGDVVEALFVVVVSEDVAEGGVLFLTVAAGEAAGGVVLIGVVEVGTHLVLFCRDRILVFQNTCRKDCSKENQFVFKGQ